MRTMLRRWLGIEDAVKVIDALDERYQHIHERVTLLGFEASKQIDFNNQFCDEKYIREGVYEFLVQRIEAVESSLSRKLSKDEFEGVNEEFRQLEDEFNEFRNRSIDKTKAVTSVIRNLSLESLFVQGGLDIALRCIEQFESQLRFLSRFIGATNKKGGGDAKV